LTAAQKMISALSVTQDRQAFMPWLLWNYRKQDYPVRELVIVDSSPQPVADDRSDNVVVVQCPPGTSVARKRNLALEAARGSMITWFDDDDWQHPRKLSILVSKLAGAPFAGCRTSWFADLHSGRARRHEGQRNAIFNSLGARRASVTTARFDERLSRAADTPWCTQLRRIHPGGTVTVPQVLFFWLCHRHNLSNPASRYVFDLPMSAIATEVGPENWSGTEQKIAELRTRLDRPLAARSIGR
jgi:glycosyltransferase involved in cell wall biosynthesis